MGKTPFHYECSQYGFRCYIKLYVGVVHGARLTQVIWWGQFQVMENMPALPKHLEYVSREQDQMSHRNFPVQVKTC